MPSLGHDERPGGNTAASPRSPPPDPRDVCVCVHDLCTQASGPPTGCLAATGPSCERRRAATGDGASGDRSSDTAIISRRTGKCTAAHMSARQASRASHRDDSAMCVTTPPSQDLFARYAAADANGRAPVPRLLPPRRTGVCARAAGRTISYASLAGREILAMPPPPSEILAMKSPCQLTLSDMPGYDSRDRESSRPENQSGTKQNGKRCSGAPGG